MTRKLALKECYRTPLMCANALTIKLFLKNACGGQKAEVRT